MGVAHYEHVLINRCDIKRRSVHRSKDEKMQTPCFWRMQKLVERHTL
jgi:hypothetical protein